ncbi:hypothetical protein MMON44395_13915 [Mycolicibacterium monacense DSM 44395]|nr:hypothetical protein [Mycolicibacterium monacense DSM 44395]
MEHGRQIEAEIDEVERGAARVERYGLPRQAEQHRLDQIQDRGIGAQSERHHQHNDDLDPQRPPLVVR